MKIISPTNPRVKDIVRLRDKKHRDKTGLTIVEGVKETAKLLASGWEIEAVFICPELLTRHGGAGLIEAVSSRQAAVFEVTLPVFQKIGYGDRLEGVLAVGRFASRELSDIRGAKRPLVVVLESVEKPGNLGAALRVCDGAGVTGLIVCDGSTDVFNPNAIRASLGTVFTVPVVTATNEETLTFFRQNKIRVVALLPEAEAFYTDADLSGPLALVFGSEDKGLSAFWEKNADTRVKIPMAGAADSLNVSTAAAIVVYESVRQRNLPATGR